MGKRSFSIFCKIVKPELTPTIAPQFCGRSGHNLRRHSSRAYKHEQGDDGKRLELVRLDRSRAHTGDWPEGMPIWAMPWGKSSRSDGLLRTQTGCEPSGHPWLG